MDRLKQHHLRQCLNIIECCFGIAGVAILPELARLPARSKVLLGSVDPLGQAIALATPQSPVQLLCLRSFLETLEHHRKGF